MSKTIPKAKKGFSIQKGINPVTWASKRATGACLGDEEKKQRRGRYARGS